MSTNQKIIIIGLVFLGLALQVVAFSLEENRLLAPVTAVVQSFLAGLVAYLVIKNNPSRRKSILWVLLSITVLLATLGFAGYRYFMSQVERDRQELFPDRAPSR